MVIVTSKTRGVRDGEEGDAAFWAEYLQDENVPVTVAGSDVQHINKNNDGE